MSRNLPPHTSVTSHPHTDPDEDKDEDVHQDIPQRISKESNKKGATEVSSPHSSTDKLRYLILSKLGVLLPSSYPQEVKFYTISDILNEVPLFWWENREKNKNNKFVINCRNYSKVNLVPMMDDKTPRYRN